MGMGKGVACQQAGFAGGTEGIDELRQGLSRKKNQTKQRNPCLDPLTHGVAEHPSHGKKTQNWKGGVQEQ